VHNDCKSGSSTPDIGTGGNKTSVAGESVPDPVKVKNKTGPKPAGTGAHNQKIAEVASQVKDGTIIAGVGIEPEQLTRIKNGYKSGRRADNLVKRPDGTIYGINVGITTATGVPIRREVEAIYDLKSEDIDMYFVPYTKRRS